MPLPPVRKVEKIVGYMYGIWHMGMRRKGVRKEDKLYPRHNLYPPPSQNPGYTTAYNCPVSDLHITVSYFVR